MQDVSFECVIISENREIFRLIYKLKLWNAKYNDRLLPFSLCPKYALLDGKLYVLDVFGRVFEVLIIIIEISEIVNVAKKNDRLLHKKQCRTLLTAVH